ncbi:MAG: DUF3343 domain-containing protein [Defluviitaleaceae bacterium]|nr:DUF3343 domain-containing protein [Defluviitaleaceae bacterium]
MSEYVLTFDNTNMAVKAEKVLLQAGFKISVMPLVAQISAGCGIALRVKPNELEQCREVLAAKKVEISCIYERKAEGRSYEYSIVSKNI